jgi:hypothetical protein
MTHPALQGRRRTTRVVRAAVGLLAAAVMVSSLSSCSLRRLGYENRKVPWVFTQHDYSSGWLQFHCGYDEDWPFAVKAAYWIGPGH